MERDGSGLGLEVAPPRIRIRGPRACPGSSRTTWGSAGSPSGSSPQEVFLSPFSALRTHRYSRIGPGHWLLPCLRFCLQLLLSSSAGPSVLSLAWNRSSQEASLIPCQSWVQISALPLTMCETLGQSCYKMGSLVLSHQALLSGK